MCPVDDAVKSDLGIGFQVIMDSKKLSAGTGGSGGVIPVKVAVRIRPISNKETEEGCQSVVSVSQRQYRLGHGYG